MIKIPVQVETVREGGIDKPAAVIMDCGKKTRISSVLYCSEAVDGEYQGIRYTVRIKNHSWYLFREGSEWFLQAA